MRTTIVRVSLLAALVLVTGLAGAQQTRKIGNVATISASNMELDWSTGNNVIDFSGNVKVTLTGQRHAQLTASALKVTLTKKLNDLVSLQASGPVSFTADAPLRGGGGRRLSCQAAGKAVYQGETQTLQLSGNVRTQLRPLEGAAGSTLAADLPPWAEHVDVESQTITSHLATNVTEFVGDVSIAVSGEYNSRMSAPRIRVTAGERSLTAEADGPVSFRSVGKDKNGAERTLVGSAQKSAVYTGSDRKVHLVGGAVVDLLPTATDGGTGSAHCTGQEITIDLKTMKLNATETNVEVKTEVEVEN